MNYDMTFCTGLREVMRPRGLPAVTVPCPLMKTCERCLPYEDRPKNRPLSWFVDPPFQGETCEHYLPSEPLSKNTREGE